MFSQPEGTNAISGVVEAFSKTDGGLDNDKAYPWLISQFVMPGFKGLVVAALAAAIVSSLASMLNSWQPFSLWIFTSYFNREATDKQTVTVGRLTAILALVIAVLVAPQLSNVPQMFQYIQEYTRVGKSRDSGRLYYGFILEENYN